MADTQQGQGIQPTTPSLPGLPTLNPEDSPYKPLDLPQQTAPAQAPPPENKPPSDLGAVTHAGAAAYMIDQVLRGASHGAAVGMQYAADQYNKKLTALQSLYNDQAAQLYSLAKSGRSGTFSGPAGPDGKPTFVPSAEFTAAKGRMLASWDAMMTTVGQRIPTPKKGKGKSQTAGATDAAGGTGSAGAGGDPSALMQQALNHKGDPQGALAATYQLGRQIGPPVVHQISGFLTPEYIERQKQADQTQGYQSQAGVTTAQTGVTTADTAAAAAGINNKLTHAVASGAPQEEIDKLLKQRDELSPSPKFPLAGLKRYTKGADGIEYEYSVDQEGNEIKDSRRPLSTAGLNPKVPTIGSFGDFMLGAYGAKPTPKQYIEGEKLWKQAAGGGTTVGTHTVLVTQGDKQVPFTFTTTSTKNVGGGGAGTAPNVRADQAGGQVATSPAVISPTTPTTPVTPKSSAGAPSHAAAGSPHPATGSHAPQQSGEAIGYKDTPEYKGLVKQAVDAQKEYNSAYTNLSTMIKTSAAAKKGDGSAQVGIISAYLKSVVGGAGTGVRITKAEWDAATGTRPFLKGIEAKFSPDGYMSGAAIAPSQVDQMTREVLAKTQALKETARAAKQRMLQAQQDQIPDNLKPKPAAAAGPTTHDDEIMNLLHPTTH